MTATAGASRLSVGSSASSLPSTRARAVSSRGAAHTESGRVPCWSPGPVITYHLHPESCSSWGPGGGPAGLASVSGLWVRGFCGGGVPGAPGVGGRWAEAGLLGQAPSCSREAIVPRPPADPRGPPLWGHQCSRRGRVSGSVRGWGRAAGGGDGVILRPRGLLWLCRPPHCVRRSVCLSVHSLSPPRYFLLGPFPVCPASCVFQPDLLAG